MGAPVAASATHFACTAARLPAAPLAFSEARCFESDRGPDRKHASRASVQDFGRHRPPRPGAARLLLAVRRDPAARPGNEHGSAWSLDRNEPFPLPRCGTPGMPKIRPELLPVGGPVTLEFLWCNSCIWEIDQAQLDKPPWSGRRQRYRCPGCGRPVVWHLHGPAWRPFEPRDSPWWP